MTKMKQDDTESPPVISMTPAMRAALHRADVVLAAFCEIQSVVAHVTGLVEWLCTNGEYWPFRYFAYYAEEARHVFGPGVQLDETHERDYEE